MLEVRALSKTFGGLTAVEDVDLRVAEGEIVSLIGPNGAGKTTLFAMISGFLAPDQGSVLYRGRELVGQRPHAICRWGVVRTFQVVELVRDIRATGVTIFLIEHVMQAVMSLSDRTCVLNQGRLIAEGTPAEITAMPEVIEAYLGHGAAARLASPRLADPRLADPRLADRGGGDA